MLKPSFLFNKIQMVILNTYAKKIIPYVPYMPLNDMKKTPESVIFISLLSYKKLKACGILCEV